MGVKLAVRLVKVSRQNYIDPALFQERERAAKPPDRLFVLKAGRLHKRVMCHDHLDAVLRYVAHVGFA